MVNPEQLEELQILIRQDRQHARRERSEWEDGLAVKRRLYAGEPDTERTLPWLNAANVNLDVIGDTVDDFTARTMAMLFGDLKWAPMAPVSGESGESLTLGEDFMQWALQVDMKIWGDSEAIVKEASILGNAFVYLSWETKKRTTLECRYEPRVIDGMTIPTNPTVKDLFKKVFGDIQQGNHRVLDSDTNTYLVLLKEAGREHYATVTIDWEPEDRLDEIKLEIVREEIVKNSPRLMLLEPTRVYFTDVGSLQESPFLHLEFDVDLDWLKRKRAKGDLNQLSDEDWDRIAQDQQVLKKQSTNRSEDEREKDRISGMDTDTQASRSRPILICFYRYDINNDGFDEEIVVEYDLNLNIVLSVDYLERRYPHGMRPVIDFKIMQTAGRIYGPSLPEILWNQQIMVNTLINQAIDGQSIRNTPFFFFGKGTGLNDREQIPLRPGIGIGINQDNPGQHILPVTLSGQSLDGLMPFVSNLVDFMDRRSGRADTIGGANRRGSQGTSPHARTFGGQTLVQQEGLIRIEHMVTMLACGGQGNCGGFNELYHQIWDLYALMMPLEMKIMVTGKDTPQTVRRSDLRMRPHFMFSINMLSASPVVRRQDALMLYQNLKGDFVGQGALVEYRNLVERLLRAYDIENPQQLIPSIPTMLKRAPMPPEMENQILMAQTPLDVLPIDDDASHIQSHMQFKQDMRDTGAFWPDSFMTLDQHIADQIAQLEQKEQAAATQANSGGRPMGGERRTPGQMRQPRPSAGGTFAT